MLLGGLAAPALAAAGDPNDLTEACDGADSGASKFSDYNQLSPRLKIVANCLSNGFKGDKGDQDYVLQGSSSGKADFAGTISRAQFAAILNRVGDVLGLAPFSGDANNPTFADVTSGQFFFQEIEELFKRGLTAGAGNDTQDVDGDGNTQELIYSPSGQVSYAQVLTFVERLLTDGAALNLPNGQSHNQSNLECGVHQPAHDQLDAAGFLRTNNIPPNCKSASARGLVFDLITVGLDQAVEDGKAQNPFVREPGDVSLVAARSSATTNEQISVTVTVLDADGNPVSGQRVELFAVTDTDGFNTDGSPKNPGTVSISGNGKFGTGNSSGVIDGGDPTTDAQGKATVKVGMTSASGGLFGVHSFIGKDGATYADANKLQGASSPKVTLEFVAVPADLQITSSADGFPLKFGDDVNTVSITVVDAQGKPIETAGIRVVAEMFRSNNGGGETLFTRLAMSTGANGVATWNAPVPNDPGTAPGGEGDRTADRFRATFDENGNDRADDAISSSQDTTVQWRDDRRSAPANATITLPGENSARNDTMGKMVGDGVQELVRVFVTNVYGEPAQGANVELNRGAPVNTGTTNNGEIVFVVNAPNVAAAHVFTARVNGGGPFTPADVNAVSVSGDADVTIHWVTD
ncbi:MAG: protocatechuate 3,4-dioxygenase beta subunit, partial [Glaciecola sp.]